jgi:hypothetical protein
LLEIFADNCNWNAATFPREQAFRLDADAPNAFAN